MSSESKRERFVRIATSRTNKILDSIRVLGNCANKNAYEYTDEDIEKIFGSIEKELKNIKNKFLETDAKKERFTLE